MEYTEKNAQRLVAAFMAKLAARPVKATYHLAKLGATTLRGGKVATASTEFETDGHRIACVGDIVRYPDGRESEIISGAGAAFIHNDRPVVIVGSTTDNGDIIVSSLQSSAQIYEYADVEGIAGLLKAGYVVPPGDGA